MRWFRRRDLPRIERVRLNPGDVLVVKSEYRPTQEQATVIREVVREKFPDHEVLVLGHDLDLSIVAVGKP